MSVDVNLNKDISTPLLFSLWWKMHLHSVSCNFFLFSHRNGMLICNFVAWSPTIHDGGTIGRIFFLLSNSIDLNFVACMSLLSGVNIHFCMVPQDLSWWDNCKEVLFLLTLEHMSIWCLVLRIFFSFFLFFLLLNLLLHWGFLGGNPYQHCCSIGAYQHPVFV